jgi:DNA-binding transcriptional ArsR family regulator
MPQKIEIKVKKRNFFRLHSDICKTLANPKRQEILDNLRQEDKTVNQLVKKTGISQANLSQHLAILRTNGIVSTRRKGINVYYSISNPKIIKAFDLISEVLEEALASQSKTIKAAINRKT